jgi:predicted dehydrogenase
VIQQVLDLAETKGLVAYDIMTERYEVTSMPHRELVNTPEVFGAIVTGDRKDPAVFMESVHRLMKSVAGVPSLRPAWFFDVDEQGEALADVGTHLVDLAQWTVPPTRLSITGTTSRCSMPGAGPRRSPWSSGGG